MVTGAMFALTSVVQAQDAAGVDGTYQWVREGRNGGAPMTNTLVLKTEAGKLAGAVTVIRNDQPTETKIEEAKFADGTVSFTLTREFNGNKMVTKFSGKVSAEGIKGKYEMDMQGNPMSVDWDAKRIAAKPAAAAPAAAPAAAAPAAAPAATPAAPAAAK